MDYQIDVVIPWVDGSDPEWLARYNRYSGRSSDDASEARYRDWDNLQYIFRGIERFWPWVDRIFLITDGQQPRWLRRDHPRLRLVNHADYIPADCLPTFSSHTIELNLHRITDMSEHFIYLNDDFFPVRPMQASDFFRNGLPCDSAEQQTLLSIYVPGDSTFRHIDFTNLGLLNAHFRKRDVTRNELRRWYGPYLGLHGMLQALMKVDQPFFTGFALFHSAQSFLKSSFERVWEVYPDFLQTHCRNRFRQCTDVNQWLVRYWQLAENRFAPCSMSRRKLYAFPSDDAAEVAAAIRSQHYDIITINDTPLLSASDFPEVKRMVNGALAEILPNKSSFEL